METLWRDALWSQFGAAIGMLEDGVRACPDALWHERLWVVPADDAVSPDMAAAWNVTFHTLFWLDFYLSGAVEEGFAPPPPFTLNEFDPAGAMPDRTYTKDELLTYLAYTRDKCQASLTTLTDDQARRVMDLHWAHGHPVTFYELTLYNMRHVQEHGAQLHLLLGQHGIHIRSWVARAQSGDGNG
ncbi:MAG TPA: DinB family protein [Ktedonobacterales bacterium]|jgi:hypothetical protein